MVGFAFRQGSSEFSTAPVRSAGPTGQAGIAHAILRIENERERRRGPKDGVYGWTLEFHTINIGFIAIYFRNESKK